MASTYTRLFGGTCTAQPTAWQNDPNYRQEGQQVHPRTADAVWQTPQWAGARGRAPDARLAVPEASRGATGR
jgi:hypothetical protein